MAHRRARDREHLLLTARQEAALAIRQLAELREQVEHALHGPPTVGPAATRDVEVFPHRELREDPPVFGHEPDAGPRDLVWRLAGDVAAFPHAPGVRGRRESP